jgi:hypothetical protein
MGVGGVNFFVSPDPNIFCTADGFMAVTANVKVSEGILFPLADAFCFVEKVSRSTTGGRMEGRMWCIPTLSNHSALGVTYH